jgi:hypothetical protein
MVLGLPDHPTSSNYTADTAPRTAVNDDSGLEEQFQQSVSFQDYQRVHEEVHGACCLSPNETPELIRSSLDKLDRELQSTAQSSSSSNPEHRLYKYSSYQTAVHLPAPSYVTTSKFKVRFLRSELFDVVKAAKRLNLFCELVLEFYGQIQHPISLRDLSRRELEMLRDGDIQPLPFRDRTGRRVIVTLNNFSLQYPLEIRVRE